MNEELAAGFDLICVMRSGVFCGSTAAWPPRPILTQSRAWWLLDKLADIAGARGGLLYLADASGEELRAAALDVK